jgi:hypothetical protein
MKTKLSESSTPAEIYAHKERMTLAREEFARYFLASLLNGFPRHEAVRIESLCWQFFLHGKGLK